MLFAYCVTDLNTKATTPVGIAAYRIELFSRIKVHGMLRTLQLLVLRLVGSLFCTHLEVEIIEILQILIDLILNANF